MKKREYDPIRVTFPDPGKIACKDCRFRDRTEVTLPSGKIVKAGVTRSTCKRYEDMKPSEVLFLNHPCRYYKKEG